MPSLDEAFKKIDRRYFVPEDLQSSTYIDAPLPIGFGQTISQPTTVYRMLDWLELETGNKVLDIGSGSGWTTALISYLISPKGKVYAVERIPELVEFGSQNCQKLDLKNVNFYEAGKDYGLSKYAPYDRILVSASASKLPENLLDQLKIGGKLVIPVRNDILEITKESEESSETIKHPGYIFVPLI